MKVVVIGTRGIPGIMGGVETHCEELYPRLVELGCDVTLIRRICYVTPENKMSIYKGVKLKDIPAPKRKNLEAIIHSFFGIIQAKKLKADILHIHAIGSALLIPFAHLLGLKVIVTHHGPDYDRQKWGRFAKFSLRQGEHFCAKFADEIIVISHIINDTLKQLYKRNNTHLIFNGVNPPVKIPTTHYLESLGLEKGRYIFAAGRFVPEKGFDLLIEAYSRLKPKRIKLVIAGDTDHATEYSSNLKKLAEIHGVILTGFIKGEKLQELLTHARLFVLPSYHEGLPIGLLEAMSYDLDVLASDIPANVEVNLPKESYLFTGSVDSLYEKLKEKLDKNHYQTTYDMSPYNWDKIAKQTYEVYKGMM